MTEQGYQVDILARRVTLQKQMSGALHDHNDLDKSRKLKKRQLRSWNERDEYFANHPSKLKYRNLTKEATELFLDASKETSLMDYFSSKEEKEEREENFQEKLLYIYKRSRRNTDLSPHLIENIKLANLKLKKEHVYEVRRLSRQ